MNAVVVPRHGGAEVLSLVKDFPDPAPRPDEVVVRVAATTVNQMDLLVRNGYPNRAIPLPHIPGGDVVGTVEWVGAEVSGVEPGRRVVVYPLIACGICSHCRSGREHLCANWQTIGIHRHGGYGELVAVPGRNVIPLPEEVPFTTAAALPVAGLTAYHALMSVGRVREGELAVIWGSTGGVGSMALQIAKRAGARVAAIVSSPERKKAAEQMGADYVLDRSLAEMGAEVRRIAPDGVDLVFDSIGAGTVPVSLGMLANGGRLLCCGILSGREARLNVHALYFHHLSIHGLFLGSREDMREVISLTARGELMPLIDRVLPMEKASEGHRLLETGGQIGKIVLTPGRETQ